MKNNNATLSLVAGAIVAVAPAFARADIVSQTFTDLGSVKVTGGAPEGFLKIQGINAFNPSLGILNGASVQVTFDVAADKNTLAFENTAPTPENALTQVTINANSGWNYTPAFGTEFDTYNSGNFFKNMSFDPLEIRKVGQVSGQVTSTVPAEFLSSVIGTGQYTNILYFNHVGSNADNDAIQFEPGDANFANVSSMVITYDYTPVPAPGALALAAASILVAARRRR